MNLFPILTVFLVGVAYGLMLEGGDRYSRRAASALFTLLSAVSVALMLVFC